MQNNGASGGTTLFFTVPKASWPNFYLVSDTSVVAILLADDLSTTTTTSSTTPAPDAVLTLANTGSPTGSGPRACAFPFQYNGKTYTSCTCAVLGQFWCSVTPNLNLDQQWGFCDTNTFNVSEVACNTGDFALRTDHPTSPLDAYAPGEEPGAGAGTAGVVAGVAVAVVVLALLTGLYVMRRQRQAKRVDIDYGATAAPVVGDSELPPAIRTFAPQGAAGTAAVTEPMKLMPHSPTKNEVRVFRHNVPVVPKSTPVATPSPQSPSVSGEINGPASPAAPMMPGVRRIEVASVPKLEALPATTMSAPAFMAGASGEEMVSAMVPLSPPRFAFVESVEEEGGYVPHLGTSSV